MARLALELPSHPFGWRLEEIQQRLGISERTLRRYLVAGEASLVDGLGRPYFQIASNGGKPKLRLSTYQTPLATTA